MWRRVLTVVWVTFPPFSLPPLLPGDKEYRAKPSSRHENKMFGNKYFTYRQYSESQKFNAPPKFSASPFCRRYRCRCNFFYSCCSTHTHNQCKRGQAKKLVKNIIITVRRLRGRRRALCITITITSKSGALLLCIKKFRKTPKNHFRFAFKVDIKSSSDCKSRLNGSFVFYLHSFARSAKGNAVQ